MRSRVAGKLALGILARMQVGEQLEFARPRSDRFRAPWILLSPLLQTWGASLPLWKPALTSETLKVPIPATDQTAEGALHVHATFRPGRGPAVIIVHGLAGSAESNYVLRAAAALLEQGFHVVRMNLRGAGVSMPDAPNLYNLGLSEDLDRVGAVIAQDPRVESVSFWGSSLGGNLVLKLAGSWGDAKPPYVRAIVAVSPVVDAGPAAVALESPRCIPYRLYVMRELVAQTHRFIKTHPSRVNFDASHITPLSMLREYDRAVIVPMHGFADIDDYYGRASCGPFLSKIAAPTSVVFAADDPMIPVSTVRPALERASKSVTVDITRRGGHVGWFEGLSREAFVKNWITRRGIEFLRARV